MSHVSTSISAPLQTGLAFSSYFATRIGKEVKIVLLIGCEVVTSHKVNKLCCILQVNPAGAVCALYQAAAPASES